MSLVEEFLNGREPDLLGVVELRKPRSSPLSHRALEIGKAAEHLVCADLILSGHRAFLTDQGLPYDVVFDHGGRLLRVQVKSTSVSRPVPGRPGSPLSYIFHVRRAGRGARRIIGNDEFDLLALVALDIRVVAYVPMGTRIRQTIHLRAPGAAFWHANKRNDNIDQYSLSRALEGILR
jgi:hypothetical protein